MRQWLPLAGGVALLLALMLRPDLAGLGIATRGAQSAVAELAGEARPLRERIGVNVVYANLPSDVSRVAGWVRDYHRWYWYETERDRITWPGSKQRVDQFYSAFRDAGVRVMVSVGMVPAWGSSNGANTGLPRAKESSGLAPSDYRAHAEYLAQLAARYGSTKHTSALRTTDRLSSLDSVRAIEGWNEPNQNWAEPRFPAAAFAQMQRADYDGAAVVARPEWPLVGVKQGDRSMLAVLPGVAGPDTGYLSQASPHWNDTPRPPFDVLSYHWFAKGNAGSGGRAPEAGGLLEGLSAMRRWRDGSAPGTPVWLTEFGWDTNSRVKSGRSVLYAPEPTAAGYLVRATFLALANGADRLFVFTYRDHNSDSPDLYSTSGLVENSSVQEGSDSRKKAGWYYLATVLSTVGEMVLTRIESQGEGEPALYAYRLAEPSSPREALVAWVRDPRTERDVGLGPAQRQLSVPWATRASLVTLEPGTAAGLRSTLEVRSPETEGASVRVGLSERPVLVEYWRGTGSGQR